MALPKAVKKQIDEANRLVEEVSKKPEPEVDETTVDEADDETDVHSDDEGGPQPDNRVVELSPPEQNIEDRFRSLEQKYSTLQGKYDKEIEEERNKRIEREREIANLQALIAAMGKAKQPSDTEHEPAAVTPKSKKRVTQEEIDEYGPELYDFIVRSAQDAFQSLLPAVEDRIKKLEGNIGKVANTVRATASDTFQSKLTELVPSWRQLNDNKEFLSWLAASDAFSGVRRHDLLRQAYEAGDVNRVARFFIAYLEESASGPSEAQPARHTPAAPARQEGSGKVRLETLVEPGKSKTSTAPAATPESKRIWTEAEISRFYNDANRGVYRHDEAAKRRIEQEIFHAVQEGRVR